MNLTKKRLQNIIQSTNKQTRKRIKKTKKNSQQTNTIRNKKQFNLNRQTIKKI